MTIDNYISELTLPKSSTVYKIKDTEAREALERKQDILEWDSYPQEGSQNPVTSDGLYNEFTRVDSEIPKNVSDLHNDIGYITEDDVPVKSVNGQTGDVITPDTKNTVGATKGSGTQYLIGVNQQSDNSKSYIIGPTNNSLAFSFGLRSKAWTEDDTSLIHQNPGSMYFKVDRDNYQTVNIDMAKGAITLSGRGDRDLDLEEDHYICFDAENDRAIIKGLVTPTDNRDATNKKYVDDLVDSIEGIKESVSNHTLIFTKV